MNIFKKQKESIILENFRNHFPDFPKGKLIPSEAPDFILKTGPKHSVGIELTAMPASSYEINHLTINRFLEDIRACILKKEEKLKNYRRKKAEAYWLIIHVESVTADKFNLNNHLERWRPEFRFERVFLFSLFEGEVLEFKFSW